MPHVDGYKGLACVSGTDTCYVSNDKSGQVCRVARLFSSPLATLAAEFYADSTRGLRLNNAHDVVISGDGVFVADSGNSRIGAFEISSGQTHLHRWFNLSAGDQPWSVYVTAVHTFVVYRSLSNGKRYLVRVSTPARLADHLPVQLGSALPHGMAISPAGDELLITQEQRILVARLPSMAMRTVLTDSPSGNYQAALWSRSQLVLLDRNRGKVCRTKDGVLGLEGRLPPQLHHNSDLLCTGMLRAPHAMDADPIHADSVIVAETANNALTRINLTDIQQTRLTILPGRCYSGVGAHAGGAQTPSAHA